MEKFRYKAVDDTGETVSGTEQAPSRGAAHLALLDRGYESVEVTQKKSVLQFEITKKRVPRKDIMHFSRQLGVFVRRASRSWRRWRSSRRRRPTSSRRSRSST